MVSVAPKFHVPIRDPDDYLFELIYYIGKHQIKLKIKATDSIGAIADKICKIYSLKPSEKTSIIDILEKELSRYY